MDGNDIKKYLAAFADGELDVEQNLKVLEKMAMCPQTTRRVMHQQQLRQAVKRHLTEECPQCPEHLRAALLALADDTPTSPASTASTATPTPAAPTAASPTPAASMTPSPSAPHAHAAVPAPPRRDVLGYVGRWAPAAVAAVLLISTMIVFQGTWQPAHDTPTASLVPAADSYVRRHTRCSKQIDPLYHRNFAAPPTIEEAPAQIAAFLETTSVTNLNLSDMGYDYIEAGECNLPGNRSVHLIYRSKSNPLDSMSLWISRYEGKPDIEAGKVYQILDASHAHPMIIWRDQDMLYHLVADNPRAIEVAELRLSSAGQ